jgi:hypothetical protein
MPYHWLDFTPPRPQIEAAPVEDFVTAAHTQAKNSDPSAEPPSCSSVNGH